MKVERGKGGINNSKDSTSSLKRDYVVIIITIIN